LALVCPARGAFAEGSTIQLVPKSPTEDEREGPRPPDRGETRTEDREPEESEARRAPGSSEGSAPDRAGEAGAAPDRRPTPEDREPEVDLTPRAPPAALDRVPAKLDRRRRGPEVMPLIGIGLSVAAGVAGAIFLAEAGRNLDPDNFTLETTEEGGRVEVELTDQFVDAQNAVIGNGIAGAILVSSASAGLLASLLALTTRRGDRAP